MLHPFWALNLLAFRALAKNTAEGADALPSLLSCPRQESDLEVSVDHGATHPSLDLLGSWVCLQPRPMSKGCK